MSALNRRELLYATGSLLSAASMPFGVKRAQAAEGAKPHFFIYAHLFFGADPSYLLDARPLALTKAGKMQNFTGVEPEPWAGANGTTALMSSVAAPLKEFKDLISVVNGCVMSAGFDGHEQNQSFIFTGSPFGGTSFIPQLNAASPLALDAVMTSQLFGVSVANDGGTLTLDAGGLSTLGAAFAGAAPLDLGHPTAKFLLAAMDSAGSGTGALSLGSQAMRKSFVSASSLSEQLKLLKFETPTTFDPMTGNPIFTVPLGFQLIEQFFRRGLSRSIVYNVFGNYDTHDNGSCKAQPATFAKTVEEIVALIKFLKATPFDEATGQSMLDVTTVMVGSEFTRTMRQLFVSSIEETGTDHNPLSNSFLLLGKGIKGGQVVGEGDMRAVDAEGNLTDVSGAHKGQDQQLIKLMGKPFDYETMKPLSVLPETYDVSQYLGFNAVANTLLDVFGVSAEAGPRRRFTAGGAVIPSLKPLIA